MYQPTEDSLRPTEDTLADLLLLINYVGPHKPLVSLVQLVPACVGLRIKKRGLFEITTISKYIRSIHDITEFLDLFGQS